MHFLVEHLIAMMHMLVCVAEDEIVGWRKIKMMAKIGWSGFVISPHMEHINTFIHTSISTMIADILWLK